MADYDSSLPVRTEGDADERLQCKIVDYTTVSQAMEVDTDNNAHVEVHGNKADDASDVALVLSETGRVNPDGLYEADDNSKPAHTGLIVHTRQTTPADSHQTKRITGVQGTNDDTHHCMDVSLHDENGDEYSLDNPLPIQIKASAPGSEVQDFKHATAIAKDASDTHTYTVTVGKTLTLEKIQASGSGKMRVEVKHGTSGSTVTTLVLFNSTANPNVEYEFAEPIQVVAADVVEVIITNLDNQAQDLYSLIEGEEN